MEYICPMCGAPLDSERSLASKAATIYMCGTCTLKGMQSYQFSPERQWCREKQYARDQSNLGNAR